MPSTRSKSRITAGVVSFNKAKTIFPEIKHKEYLEYKIVEEDQIIVIEDFLSPEECKLYISFIDKLPLELTPLKKKDEADRLNHRLSVQDAQFAEALFNLLKPHLPPLPAPKIKPQKTDAGTSNEPHSCNSNIRFYRYSPTHHFGPHYDDSVKDTISGAESEWTILIYLTGEGQGVVGGQTTFYSEKKGQKTQEIIVPLVRGTALLHR